MQITRQQLVEWEACDGLIQWFDANYPSGDGEYIEVQMALHRDRKYSYSNWLSERVLYLPDGADAECDFAADLALKMTSKIGENVADDSLHASTGYGSRHASTGYGSRHASTGSYSRHASTGNYSSHEATGANTVIAAAGVGSTIKLADGGSAAVAYHDGTRVRFAVAYEGENVKAGIWYKVNDRGEFVEIKQ